jgi:hypothetical protein
VFYLIVTTEDKHILSTDINDYDHTRRQVVDRLLKERKSLLTSALVAVVEALRMNPDRYAVIYNSKYDNNESFLDGSRGTTTGTISSAFSTEP